MSQIAVAKKNGKIKNGRFYFVYNKKVWFIRSEQVKKLYYFNDRKSFELGKIEPKKPHVEPVNSGKNVRCHYRENKTLTEINDLGSGYQGFDETDLPIDFWITTNLNP